MILKNKEDIDMFRLLQLRSALYLETKGLKHSSGRSVYALIKKEYNLKGNKENVLKQIEQIIQIQKEKRGINR